MLSYNHVSLLGALIAISLLCLQGCNAVSSEQTCGTGKVISRLINDESGNLKITCVELNCTRIREEKEKCVPYAPTCEDDRWIRAIAKDDSGSLVVRCCTYSKITDLKRKDILKSPDTFKTEYVVDEKSETYYHEVVSNIKPLGDKTYELTTNHLKCVPPPGTTGIQPLNLNGPRGGTPRLQFTNAAGAPVAVGAVCFPGDSVVETPRGMKTMSELRIGDEVLSSTEGGVSQFDQISYFLHRDPRITARFLEIRTETGNLITLTPDHLISAVPCNYSPARFRVQNNELYKFAREVGVGDCVLTRGVDQHIAVERVSAVSTVVKQGVYAPVTTRSNLIVDGVVASCFSLSKQTVLMRNYFNMIQEWIEILGSFLPVELVERFLGLHSSSANECLECEGKAVQFPLIVQGLYEHLSLFLPPSVFA